MVNSIINNLINKKQTMGNETTKVKNQEGNFNNSLNHPILKNAKVVQKGKDLQLQLVIAVPSKQIYQNWKSKTKSYTQPFLQNQALFIPKSLQYQGSGVCGSSGVIKAVYSYPPLLLSEQFQNRISIMRPFNQQQIWYLFFVLVYAASINHNKNIILGDIRPRNIFLFQQGDIAVSCMASFLQQATSYKKSSNLKQKTFLASQQIIGIQENMVDESNPIESQNFAIGMTVMSLMLLRDEQKLYFTDNTIFDTEQFKKQLSYLYHCQTYSPLLKNLVLGLLQTSTQSRLTSQQIMRLLSNYQQSIISLDKFNIDDKNIEPKLKQKLSKIMSNKYEQTPSRIISYKPHKSHKSFKSNYSQNGNYQGFQQNNAQFNPANNINNSHQHQVQKQLFISPVFDSQRNSFNLNKKQANTTQRAFLPASSSHQKFSNQYQVQDSSDYKHQNKVSKSVDVRKSNGIHFSEPQQHYEPYHHQQASPNKNDNFRVRLQSSDYISIPYKAPEQNHHRGQIQSKISFSKNSNNQISFLNSGNLGQSIHQKQSNSSKNNKINLNKYNDLQQIGRQAKSIKNPSQFRLKKQQDIKEFLKNIDQIVQKSQNMYPGQT